MCKAIQASNKEIPTFVGCYSALLFVCCGVSLFCWAFYDVQEFKIEYENNDKTHDIIKCHCTPLTAYCDGGMSYAPDFFKDCFILNNNNNLTELFFEILLALYIFVLLVSAIFMIYGCCCSKAKDTDYKPECIICHKGKCKICNNEEKGWRCLLVIAIIIGILFGIFSITMYVYFHIFNKNNLCIDYNKNGNGNDCNGVDWFYVDNSSADGENLLIWIISGIFMLILSIPFLLIFLWVLQSMNKYNKYVRRASYKKILMNVTPSSKRRKPKHNCLTCYGTGKVYAEMSTSAIDDAKLEQIDCNVCNGKGYYYE